MKLHAPLTTMQLRALLTLVATAIISFGCASEAPIKNKHENSISIKIDYLSNGTDYRNKNITYKLLPMEGGEFDLRQLKIGKEFKRILKASGMKESDNPDIIVFFIYKNRGISENEHSIPYAIRGQTGISSTTTTGTISGGYISMRTTAIPTYGTTGYGEHKYKTYTARHHLSMVAVDAERLKKGSPKQLWAANADSAGEVIDEDLALKALLMAIKDGIGNPRDRSYRTDMTIKEILNPSPDMGLDIDGNTERFYIAINALKPNKEVIKKISNWEIFCHKTDGKTTGCGMSDTGITVLLASKEYPGIIIIGGDDFLAAGSDVCLELDVDITCHKIGERKAVHSHPKNMTFGGNLLWKLEKATQVRITYTSDSGKISKNIEMRNYSDAIDAVRRSLP